MSFGFPNRNPSIQIYPHNPSQVDLSSVQNLANVFENIYEQQPPPNVRTSSRLAAKPKINYDAIANPRRY